MQRNFIFNGGLSKRYHTVHTLKEQDIAAHSFGVAWLCELITEGMASKNLIMAALAHDLAEHIVGDIPSPAKRALGISEMYGKFEADYLSSAGVGHYIEQLTAPEANILKFADMLDGMMFCVRERRLGNKNIDIVYARFNSYIWELVEKFKVLVVPTYVLMAANITKAINKEWEDLE